ncbi:MAG: hypothetical protein KGJ89_00235 [Patescibacteria group bacterium]|nr:hypothetical protein [Patescibacteria group bacterium]MDE2014949.1 hypothetical protein [Patescibacteria group bacterium]MDE2226378.1 hypothetical protein [Patescibacteria group bacterium]
MIDLKFWRPKEKYLLIDIAPQKTRGLLLGLDKDKNLTLEKIWAEFPLETWHNSKITKLRKRNMIVSADPSLAVAVSYPIEMKRAPDDHTKQLNMVELDNLLSQAIGKGFGPERAEAARRLGLHELDTVLVNAEVDNFKIDGHYVVNPLSFPGKVVGAVMRLTFTARPVFDYLKYFFGSGDGFFFTSEARAGLFSLAKIQQPPVNLAIIGSGGVSCFSLEKSAWGNVVYEEKFDWRHNSLIDSIISAFHVGQESAELIYRKYLSGDISESFKKFMDRILKPEVSNFLNGLKSSRLKGQTFFHSLLPLPIDTPLNYGRFTLHDLPAREAFDKFGFGLDFADWPMPPNEIFMRLAPFFEFYYDKRDSEINHHLRRRIHWLVQ